MLESASTHAMIAVSDLDIAKQFYGGTLGLMASDERPGAGVRYETGGTWFLVYRCCPTTRIGSDWACWVGGKYRGFINFTWRVHGQTVAPRQRRRTKPTNASKATTSLHASAPRAATVATTTTKTAIGPRNGIMKMRNTHRTIAGSHANHAYTDLPSIWLLLG
jgi:hypothetical protein